jgi:Domain of unknown function (DUF4340)
VEGTWRITAPISAPAEPFNVQRLLSIAEAKYTLQLPAADLDRFDLVTPQVKVALDAESFAFGSVNPVTNEQYVLTRNAVYAIPARYASTIPADPARLVRRQLLDPGKKPVRFQFRDFTLTHRDARWSLTPEPASLSQDDALRWIEQWQNAAALRVEPWDGRPAIDAVTVEFEGGTRMVLNIIQRDPQLIIRPDREELMYSFPADSVRRLLTPPAAARTVTRR